MKSREGLVATGQLWKEKQAEGRLRNIHDAFLKCISPYFEASKRVLTGNISALKKYREYL
jgi:hypothetical protein